MKISDLTKLSVAALALGVFGTAGLGCESTGNDIEDAAHDAGDMMEDAMDDAGDAMEDAGDEIKDATN